MRTPAWETTPGALVALLNSGQPLELCDLYTIALANGMVLRWTSYDGPIIGNDQQWQLGPGIERSKCKWSVGVQVDSLQITLTADERRPYIIGGMPLLAYISRRGFSGARVRLDRAFWGSQDQMPVGAVHMFSGRVADVREVDRFGALLEIKSYLEMLNVQVPRELYQAQCLKTVYDLECAVAPLAHQVAGQATSASTLGRTRFDSNVIRAAGHFDLGMLTWTSGPNAGVSRTVKSQSAGGEFSLLSPLPAAVSPGDAFVVLPGCDGLQATCTAKFNNLARFKGQPYIPQAETIT